MAKEITELDRKLQEIALFNWNQFVQLVGDDAILSAKICLLRTAGKSYGAITQKLGVTIDAARWNCNKCEVKSNT